MKKVIEEYDPQYCRTQELAYGDGMISEGGVEAIDSMFKGFEIEGKKALDIGSGLGGVAYHLAKKYAMEVTGLEINPWMIEEAKRRAPEEIKDKLSFVQSIDNDHFPLQTNSFDFVYSKGVFCQIEDKRGILKECYRVLKPGGALILNDWLSPVKGEWGGYVKRLIELEDLSIFAETIEGYLEMLSNANFKDIKYFNLTEKYASYNDQIVEGLKSAEKKERYIQSFGQRLYEEAIEGFESIANSIRAGEGLVILFNAFKKVDQ